MKPSDKDPKLTAEIDSMAETTFGISRTQAIQTNCCVFCRQHFTHEQIATWTPLDRKEFSISGICPKCWEETFNEYR